MWNLVYLEFSIPAYRGAMDQAFHTVTSFARELGIYFAVFAALAIVVKRQRIVEAVKRSRREFGTNLGLTVVNALVIGPLFAAPTIAFAAFLDGSGLFGAFWDGLPELFVLLLAIVLVDFVAYWRHRLEHTPELWRFHATHHADTAIHWLSVQRKHPVAKIIAMLFDTALILALGFPAWAVIGAAVLRSAWGHFIHADVPWTLGLFGEVLISPAAHRLHHIRDEELMGTNYGNTVTLWDKLFGTWCDPAPYVDCETGIEEGTRGLLGELKRPWEARYRGAAAEPEPARELI